MLTWEWKLEATIINIVAADPTINLSPARDGFDVRSSPSILLINSKVKLRIAAGLQKLIVTFVYIKNY